MKNRPIFFQVLSVIFLGLAVSFPVQISVLYEQSFSEFANIFDKISVLNWLVIGLLLLNAYFLKNISPWLKWSIPVTALMVSYNNYVVSSLGEHYSLVQTLLASGMFTVLCSSIFLTPFRYLILNPEKRWWRASPRRKLMRPIFITFENGEAIKGITQNVSDSGVFISLERLELKTLGPQSRKITALEFQHLFEKGRTIQISTKFHAQQRSMKAVVERKTLDENLDGPVGIAISYKKPWWCHLEGNPILRAI